MFCRHNFYFFAHINCPNSRWPPKLLTNRVFDHNFQITQTGNGDFTKPVDHMCVQKGYLSESMANEMVVVEKVTKVISKYTGDLTKNFDQVCVWYHCKGNLSGPWEANNGN